MIYYPDINLWVAIHLTQIGCLQIIAQSYFSISWYRTKAHCRATAN